MSFCFPSFLGRGREAGNLGLERDDILVPEDSQNKLGNDL